MKRMDPHSYTNIEQGKVKHLDLVLDIDFTTRRLKGIASLSFESPLKTTELHLDTKDIEIVDVRDENSNSLRWHMDKPQGFMGSRLVVEPIAEPSKISIDYLTSPQAFALQWLEPSQTAGGIHPYLFSQCQPHHARSIIPLQDSPAVRFTYTAELVVPEGLVAVMAAASDGNNPRKDGKRSFLFKMPQAIPSYLIALAVGDIISKEIGPRSTVYAEPSVIEDAAWEFAEIESMISAAEDIFGPYMWDRFDVLVMPPSFPYGGMENPRLTFLTPTLIAKDRSLVNVLAHELAHSWTGNLVTNATMNDFWLNEGFTVWAERRIVERLWGDGAKVLAAALGRNGLLEEFTRFGETSDLTRLKVDLEGVDPDEVYSLVPYEKGFLFVESLERSVGRQRFDKFIKEYITRFSFKSLTTAEFEDFLESALPEAIPLLDIQQWIHEPGLPDSSPRFSSKELSHIQNLATSWLTGVKPDPAVASKWNPDYWQIYLQGLPRRISKEACLFLDETYGFTQSKNAEILSNWLIIALGSSYEPAYARANEFLSSVGRMKYLKPIYASMMKNNEIKVLARRIYEKNKDKYHPITNAVLEKILTDKHE